ncbi:MAG: hypothetical protein POG74_12835 [Acidocella sp.]|nr:hypothetical protein [Acidocella sp.]
MKHGDFKAPHHAKLKNPVRKLKAGHKGPARPKGMAPAKPMRPAKPAHPGGAHRGRR